MFIPLAFSLGLLTAAAPVVAAPNGGSRNGAKACAKLAAKFPSKVFLPGTPIYSLESNASVWSKTCVLAPACVFTPSNERDVSDALCIIQETQAQFSVRSGGHMPVVGAQSNDGGVEIALTNINKLTMSADRSVASVTPGNRWLEVYNWTSQWGLGVTGGRYGQVGVGGLLTSGGITFFGSQYGWAFNGVVGYQVVLGNGSIIEVSARAHPDLFWALKGGSNNYGIITRFDMKTFPITSAFSGGTIWTGDQVPAVIDAIQSFIMPGGGIDDVATEINPTIEVHTDENLFRPYYIPFVRGSVTNPRSLENFTSIPGATFDDVTLRPDWVSVPAEVEQLDSNELREQFRTLSLKAAPGVVQLAHDLVLVPALQQLSSVKGGRVAVAYQPVSKQWLQAARDAGGDAIDLDPADGSFLTILITTVWEDPAYDNIMNRFSAAAAANLTKKAKQLGVNYDFIYLGDAAGGQNPYQFYGKGKSYPRMKAIQKKYDNLGVMQNLATSGFKL